jgi:hypothetical protein
MYFILNTKYTLNYRTLTTFHNFLRRQIILKVLAASTVFKQIELTRYAFHLNELST